MARGIVLVVHSPALEIANNHDVCQCERVLRLHLILSIRPVTICTADSFTSLLCFILLFMPWQGCVVMLEVAGVVSLMDQAINSSCKLSAIT